MDLWLANALVALHFVLMASVIAGSVAAITGRLRRNPRWERAFYGLLFLMGVSQVLMGTCALTAWEIALRARAGDGYRGGFIAHYLPFLPVFVTGYMGYLLAALSLLAYPYWRWQDRRSRTSPSSPAPSPHGSAD